MRDLKKGDDVFFMNKSDKGWRWVGHVEKIRKNDVQFIYSPLFIDNDDEKIKKSKDYFSMNWVEEKEKDWELYRVTKKEKERLDKELILINL